MLDNWAITAFISPIIFCDWFEIESTSLIAPEISSRFLEEFRVFSAILPADMLAFDIV